MFLRKLNIYTAPFQTSTAEGLRDRLDFSLSHWLILSGPSEIVTSCVCYSLHQWELRLNSASLKQIVLCFAFCALILLERLMCKYQIDTLPRSKNGSLTID